MATYTIAATKRATGRKTLAASTEDTVTIDAAAAGGYWRDVEVYVKPTAADDVFVTTDGTAATVDGDNTYICPPGAFTKLPQPASGAGTVRLISAGIGTYVVTVTAADEDDD